MRAIIIQDSDAKALVDKLRLAKLEMDRLVNHEGRDGPKTVESLADEIHRKFHYHVVSWLQQQGANLQ